MGLAASKRAEVPEDTWITGHDSEFAAELGSRGWLGMTWPVEHGGGGRSILERFVVFEQLIATGAPIAAAWFADRQMGPSLLAFGTDEQRARWLPGIVAGLWVGFFEELGWTGSPCPGCGGGTASWPPGSSWAWCGARACCGPRSRP